MITNTAFRPFPEKAVFRRRPAKTYMTDDFKDGEIITRIGPDPKRHYAWYSNDEGNMRLVTYDEIKDCED